MINSRKIEDLEPVVASKARAFIEACRAEGIDLLITSTFRDFDSQTALYAQGRTTPGNIVTNAKGGYSFHNFRCALDVVPLRGGKPVWGTQSEDGALWHRVAEIGKECGLEWAGDWKSFKEMAHFQYTGGLTLAELRGGKQVK
jgi:peptidoglycan L-alanyl-D-glutamate endopeptidase CwlK